jgi:synaptic vesicle membrane protein VAT-1
MRQIYITGHGGPKKMQVRESPDPQPRDSELRIRVKASGINFADPRGSIGLR